MNLVAAKLYFPIRLNGGWIYEFDMIASYNFIQTYIIYFTCLLMYVSIYIGPQNVFALPSIEYSTIWMHISQRRKNIIHRSKQTNFTHYVADIYRKFSRFCSCVR